MAQPLDIGAVLKALRTPQGDQSPQIDFAAPAPKYRPQFDLNDALRRVDAWHKSLPIDFQRRNGGGMLIVKGKF